MSEQINLCGQSQLEELDAARARIAALEAGRDAAVARAKKAETRCVTLRELADNSAAEQGEYARKMMEAQSQRDAVVAERDAAELRGARIVLDAIADTGFFGIAGEYGSAEKRDVVIRAALAKRRDG